MESNIQFLSVLSLTSVLQLFAHVFTALPLATLVSATLAPVVSSPKPILSPEGRKRYFVVHGGLFSKDGVTLDEIRKIPRLGQQPGNEGLLCEVRNLVNPDSLFTHCEAAFMDRPSRTARSRPK